jgi:hypothetical protein
MRKVLVIAYNFPPVAVRSHRVMGFVKYLSHHGWWPIVLTPRRPIAPEMDPCLLWETAGYPATVYRTRSFEPAGLIGRLKGWPAGGREGAAGHRRLPAFARWVSANCLVPDYRIGWVPWAIAAGWRIIRSEDVAAIMVDVAPFSSLLAAVALKRLTGQPLLMDFHDDWTGWQRFRDPKKLAVIGAFERWLESRLIRAADTVVAATPELRDALQRRYPHLHARFTSVSNGWDPSDFAGPPPSRRPFLTITHAGTLYPSRFPAAVLTALNELCRERPELRNQVRLQIAGTITGEIAETLRRAPFPEIIDYRGFLSPREARQLMRESDILLLQEESEHDVATVSRPSKLYEYLGAERFILALAGPGPIRTVVEHTAAGVVIDRTDVAAVRALLVKWIEGRHRDPVIDEEHRRRRLRFTRPSLAAALAGRLDRIVAGS